MATGRIGTTPVLRTRWSKEPAGGTTSLSGLDDYSVSLVYEVGYEAVYQNGALLSRGNDYTATDGTTITLTNATVAGDIIEVFANNVVPLTDTYSQSVADGKFVNNTIVDAKGDLIVGSAADTFTRLAVGSANQVLTVDSATTSGLKWASPSSGGMTLLASGSLANSGIDLQSISGSYEQLRLVISDIDMSTSDENFIRLNNDSNGNYYGYRTIASNASSTQNSANGATYFKIDNNYMSTTNNGAVLIADLPNYAKTTGYKLITIRTAYVSSGSANETVTYFGWWKNENAVTRITFASQGNFFDGGTYELWGMK